MASDPPSKLPPRGKMSSLYANLLDPSAKDEASITRAPVVFKPAGADQTPTEEVKKQQSNAAALRFQPNFRRPQPNANQKSKPKTLPTKTLGSVASQDTKATATDVAENGSPAPSNNLARWTNLEDDDDMNGFHAPDKPQRGGRKRRKKNKQEDAAALRQDWDDIYDPSRPNNYEEYKNSDERFRDIRDWKDRLYAHRTRREYLSDSDSDRRPSTFNKQFAPPPPSFAPPPDLNAAQPSPPPPPPPASVSQVQIEAQSGDDAFARRAQLSQTGPSSAASYQTNPTSTISKAPVRYNLPPAPASLPANDAELEDELRDEIANDATGSGEQGQSSSDPSAPRSLRPGQSGFAARLMSKYGWSKGSGLGAANDGIINPLKVKVEKAKRKPDSEGGGRVGPPGARGTIIDGRKRAKLDGSEAENDGTRMSEVVVLENMVDGIDIEEEMAGLVQEIGEECSEKYGHVERVYIHVPTLDSSLPKVFVKFTSQLSALRAVNALQGRIFNGNTIHAKYFDTNAFEQRRLD